MAASRLLRVIAGDTAIPALQAMLADPRVGGLRDLRAPADARRRRGERAGAGRSRRRAARQKAAIVAALGAAARVERVCRCSSRCSAHPALAAPAAVALGRIGGRSRRGRPGVAYGAASGESKRALAASLLEAGDGLLAAKDSEAAARSSARSPSDAFAPCADAHGGVHRRHLGGWPSRLHRPRDDARRRRCRREAAAIAPDRRRSSRPTASGRCATAAAPA